MIPRNIRISIAVLSFMICAVVPALPQISTAKVTGGTVEGVVEDGIASFKGIPFAAAPVGDLRWRSPQPVKAWEGVKKAETYAAGCMQDTAFVSKMGVAPNVSEDCLYLNVWTGAKSANERRPVMVWIYGGAFVGGMTSFPTTDGTNIARRGMVLVSVAYRVGPMGFLAHAELSAESGTGSGTYGIQDQIAGLKWVKKNIARFGGDPLNVTIFGESAGGMSVGMLVASPMAKGLFHRAISESGGAVSPSRGSLKAAEEQGKTFLSQLGVKNIKAARALSAEAVQKSKGSFWPVADGTTILENPYGLFETGKFNDTPILVGTNSHEGRLFSTQKTTGSAFEKMIRDRFAETADLFLDAYPHATEAEATRSNQDIMRESIFAWPTWAWAKLQSSIGKYRVFAYYFDHRTAASPDGADHAAEIPYVFGNLGGSGKSTGPEDKALSDLMSSYWVNFAKNGDPNGPGLPAWPVFDERGQMTMFFDQLPSAKPHPNLEKLMAFDAYYAKLREEAKTGK